jgi:hypothetical protein
MADKPIAPNEDPLDQPLSDYQRAQIEEQLADAEAGRPAGDRG